MSVCLPEAEESSEKLGDLGNPWRPFWDSGPKVDHLFVSEDSDRSTWSAQFSIVTNQLDYTNKLSQSHLFKLNQSPFSLNVFLFYCIFIFEFVVNQWQFFGCKHVESCHVKYFSSFWIQSVVIQTKRHKAREKYVLLGITLHSRSFFLFNLVHCKNTIKFFFKFK